MAEKNNIVLILVLGLVAVSLILVYNLTMQQTSDTIAASGEGAITTSPDIAYIYLGVETTNEDAKIAQSDNKDITNRVIETLKSSGVAEDKIETYSYNLDKEQKWNPTTQEYDDIGYTLRNVLKIETSDTKEVGKYVDLAVNAGANGIDRVIFDLSKDKSKEVSAEAMAKASTAAKEKAESLASNLGVSLGKLKSVTESQYNYIPYNYYAPRAAAMEKADTTTINPQNVEVTASVSLSYEIK